MILHKQRQLATKAVLKTSIQRFLVPALLLCATTVQAESVSNASSQGCVAYLAYTEGYWQAWVMDANGNNRRQITTSSYEKNRLSWYPDGKSLLISGNQGGIAKAAVSTGKEERIQFSVEGMNDAIISPDGEQIAFSLSTSGSRDDHNIWLADIKTKKLKKLTHLKRMQHVPFWGPQGESVYFTSNVDGQSHDIWRINLDGKSKQQMTGGQLYNFSVAVSNDGDLAYSSNRSGNYEIWIQKQNAKPQQMTDHPARDGSPSWSAKGDALVFESSRGDVVNIWKLDIKTNSVKQLTKHKVGARAPVWHTSAKGSAAC